MIKHLKVMRSILILETWKLNNFMEQWNILLTLLPLKPTFKWDSKIMSTTWLKLETLDLP
jgi:hypothetical protein